MLTLTSFWLIWFQLGYAILAAEGSSIDVSYTNFLDNNFTGLGTLIVLDGGNYSVMNNYGTSDDGLSCNFLAASLAGSSDVTCVEYDLDSPVVITEAPTRAPTTQEIDTSAPTLAPIIPETKAPVPAPVAPPVEPPVEAPSEMAPSGKGGKGGSKSKGKKGSGKKSAKSDKKSKSSSYCNGSKKSGRCLKRLPE